MNRKQMIAEIDRIGEVIDVRREIDYDSMDDAQVEQTLQAMQAIKRERIKRLRREFDALLRDIQQMTGQRRRILVYLSQRESTLVDEKTLARMIGISLNSLRPVPLINMGLIKRTVNASRTLYLYQSTARQKIKVLCPDLDADALVDKICKLERL